MIKAIDTEYKGKLFRSRLEARWAVFFDNIGLDWLYEHEGYEMTYNNRGREEIVRYLPDFYMPTWDGGWYAEIKPIGFTKEEMKKVILLSLETQKRIMLCVGTPNTEPINYFDPESYEENNERQLDYITNFESNEDLGSAKWHTDFNEYCKNQPFVPFVDLLELPEDKYPIEDLLEKYDFGILNGFPNMSDDSKYYRMYIMPGFSMKDYKSDDDGFGRYINAIKVANQMRFEFKDKKITNKLL